MGIGKWFQTGYEAVHDYSEELDRKHEEAKNRTPFVPNLILGDGESRVIHFITSTPITFREHYLPNAKSKKYFTCLEGTLNQHGERLECPFCSAGNKPSFRGAFLVIDRTEDKWKDSKGEVHTTINAVKVFKQGIKVLKVLDKISLKKDIKKWEMEVTRTGESTDTQYNFIPEEQLPFTEEDLKRIEEFKGDKQLIDKLSAELEPLSMEDALTVLSGGTVKVKTEDKSENADDEEKPKAKTSPKYSDDDTLGF